MASAAIVVGNPKAGSRTLTVAEEVMSQLSACLGSDSDPRGSDPRDSGPLVVDLAEHTGSVFDWGCATMAALTAEVARCRLLVVASPTYKATYTGLLKSFLDRYGNDGLRGVVAVPVMVGAAPIHAMAPEVYLRPLLVELGATVPARSLYVVEPDIPRLPEVAAKWAATARPLIAAALLTHKVASDKEE
jgi:FMN reductase